MKLHRAQMIDFCRPVADIIKFQATVCSVRFRSIALNRDYTSVISETLCGLCGAKFRHDIDLLYDRLDDDQS